MFLSRVYPIMAVVFRLEEVAFGLCPASAAFGATAMVEAVSGGPLAVVHPRARVAFRRAVGGIAPRRFSRLLVVDA
jgi:hypothetical protein